MRDYEIICGFFVKEIPQKPDFLPISQDEFIEHTLKALTFGDEDSRVSAVFHGGAREWSALWNDESYKVRGAVACFAKEEYQLKLVCDPITPVRKLLAIYGTDKVRRALLEQGETDKEVIRNIAKFGSTLLRHKAIDAAWDDPETLCQISPYLPITGLERLLSHPNMGVRVKAALHGNLEQCQRTLEMIANTKDITLAFMRDDLIYRLRELDEVDQAINYGQTQTHKYQEMEL